MAVSKGICQSQNKMHNSCPVLMRTVVVLSFLVCSSSHMPLTDGPTWPPWHDKRPPLWGNGFAICRSPQQLCRVFFCWLPVASLSLFSFAFHTQAIKSVSQCCDPLQHSLFLFFVVFLFLSFSPSLPPSCGFVSRVRRSRLGAEQREKEKPRRGGYICSFMTNHMCFWVFVFTCFSWKREWWKGMAGEERQAYGSCLS